MNCKSCTHYHFFEMITSGRPYGYSGKIPCHTCSRYAYFSDQYAPAGKVEPVPQPTTAPAQNGEVKE